MTLNSSSRYFLLGCVLLLGACASAPQSPTGEGSTSTPSATVASAPLATPTPPVPKAPPRIGLALGGGAARGFAHVGVIQVLEEAGIQPQLVAGTSAGSLVAAIYASGKKGDELQRVALTMEEAAIADWTLARFSVVACCVARRWRAMSTTKCVRV